MEQVSLSNVATNSGEDSLEVIFSTPERINNIQNAKRLARGVDGPSKRHIADGLGALHSMCSNIQATQNKQGDYLQRLEEQMHAQIHGVLQQQSSVQNQLSQIENFLENFQADKGAMDLKSVVLDLRSTSNKLTAVAIQHTTGVAQVRSTANMLNALMESSLNIGQRESYDRVLQAICMNIETVFFLDGPGGTGKTYLYNALLSKIRGESSVALACASSGIAAQLLSNGRIAHSRFKIPIDVSVESTCNIKVNSQLAQLLRMASLIIWDEAPMTHRHAFEALDKMLRDVMQNNMLFGGKVLQLKHNVPVKFK
ncbi:hypothetical protein L7F22_045055 [Adiantum nelumboides]|nr:hypothetical protein [Adiantum nelumboides]